MQQSTLEKPGFPTWNLRFKWGKLIFSWLPGTKWDNLRLTVELENIVQRWYCLVKIVFPFILSKQHNGCFKTILITILMKTPNKIFNALKLIKKQIWLGRLRLKRSLYYSNYSFSDTEEIRHLEQKIFCCTRHCILPFLSILISK